MLFWYYVINSLEANENKKKKHFIIIVCLQWILISGLRHDIVGNDTVSYLGIFDINAEMTFSEILQYCWTYIRSGEIPSVIGANVEPGFVLFNKLISLITVNHTAYKFLIATIFMAALGNYIYRYSENPCLSFGLYNVLFFNMFSLTGYRQVIAVSIAVLYGYRYVRERKIAKFVLCILIGMLFHKTTIFFLLFYFVANKKITKPYVALACMLFAVGMAFRTQLFNIVKVFLGYEQYDNRNDTLAQVGFLLAFSMYTILAVVCSKKILPNSVEATHYYNGLILSWLVFPFIIDHPTMLRLLQNYAFVLMLLLPKIVNSFPVRKNQRGVASLVIHMVFLLYLILNGGSYWFYWQSV